MDETFTASPSSSKNPKSCRSFSCRHGRVPWNISAFLHRHCHQQVQSSFTVHLESLAVPPPTSNIHRIQAFKSRKKNSCCSEGGMIDVHTSFAQQQSLIACNVSSSSQ